MSKTEKSATAIDNHNCIWAEQLGLILKMNCNALAEHPEDAATIPPLMVWGAPGCGKSTVIKSVAQQLGIGFIDIRLAQREPVDLKGLPVPNKEDKSVEWFITGDLPRDPKSRGIILFDEITAADRSLQVAAYELILDRRLGENYKIPDGWYIVGAGNRVEDRAVATTMSAALANRFMHVELESNWEQWSRWAQKNDIHPSVTGFIAFRPNYLFHQEGENLERGWPTPRAWERVSRMLNIFHGSDESLIRSLVYGLVGNRAGVEFVEFHKINKNFGSVLQMMTDPKAKIVIPTQPDRIYALCSAMTYLVWRGENEDDQARRVDGFYRICMALSSDFASMAMMAAMQGTKSFPGDQACEYLFQHKMYQQWSDAHGKALRQRYRF